MSPVASFVIVDTVLLREASGDAAVFALDEVAIGIVLGLEDVLGSDDVCSLWNDDFFQSSVLDEGVELPLNGIDPFLTFGLGPGQGFLIRERDRKSVV